jgi:hypothetical protein
MTSIKFGKFTRFSSNQGHLEACLLFMLTSYSDLRGRSLTTTQGRRAHATLPFNNLKYHTIMSNCNAELYREATISVYKSVGLFRLAAQLSSSDLNGSTYCSLATVKLASCKQ